MKEALALRQGEAAGHRLRRSGISGAGERLGAIDYEDFLARRRRRISPGGCRTTSGTRSRSTTRRAPPAIPRASSITIAAPICSRSATSLTCGMRQASGLSVDAADVPLQRLVLSVDAVGRRRHACLPARGARRRRSSTPSPTHKVTHLCGAPIVMSTLLNAPAAGEEAAAARRSSSSPRRRRRPRRCSRR